MKKSIKKRTCKLCMTSGEEITLIVVSFIFVALPVLKMFNIIP